MGRLLAYLQRHHVALLALFVALGGTSYAAVKLPRNSVGTKQLKKNAVISSKVKDRSLLKRDFKPGQLPQGARGATGPRGATGARGAQGPKGDRGDPTYKRTILVSPVGTPAQNGAALRAAIAAAGSGSVPPSSTDPYLVKIEPGTYDIGTTPLIMRSFVNLEGSGEFNTVITGSVGEDTQGTIVGVNGGRLQNLGIVNRGVQSPPGDTAAYSTAIYANVTSFSLDHVFATAFQAVSVRGVVVDGASSLLRVSSSLLIGSNTYGSETNVASGLVIRNGARALLDDSDVEAFSSAVVIAAQVKNPNSVLDADWSKFSASNGPFGLASVTVDDNASATLKASALTGPATAGTFGTLVCAQSFTHTGAELSPACG